MKSRRLPLIAALAAFGAFAAPALAQGNYVSKSGDEIVIRPYGIERHSNRFGEEIFSLTRVVTSSGLDLRYDNDVNELHRRVSYTARSICEELDDELRGRTVTTDNQCVREAVRGARPQIEAAIDRARY
ncbi:MAG: UrcA family protein [Hyphomonadaceae bacterium]